MCYWHHTSAHPWCQHRSSICPHSLRPSPRRLHFEGNVNWSHGGAAASQAAYRSAAGWQIARAGAAGPCTLACALAAPTWPVLRYDTCIRTICRASMSDASMHRITPGPGVGVAHAPTPGTLQAESSHVVPSQQSIGKSTRQKLPSPKHGGGGTATASSTISVRAPGQFADVYGEHSVQVHPIQRTRLP